MTNLIISNSLIMLLLAAVWGLSAIIIVKALQNLIMRSAEFITAQLRRFKFFRKSSEKTVLFTLLVTLFTIEAMTMLGFLGVLICSDTPPILSMIGDLLIGFSPMVALTVIGCAIMLANYAHNQRLYKIFLPRYWFGDTTENAIIPTQTHDHESINTHKANQKDALIVSVDKNIIRQIALVWLKPDPSKAPTDAMNFALSCRYFYALLHHDLRDPYIKRLLTHTLNGNHSGIRDALTISPKLLLLRGSIYDGQGNTIDQVTAYQLTYLSRSGKSARQTLKPFFHQLDRALDKSLYQRQMQCLTEVSDPAEQESLKQYASNLNAFARYYDAAADDNGFLPLMVHMAPSIKLNMELPDPDPDPDPDAQYATELKSSSEASTLVRFHLLKNAKKILDDHPDWCKRKKDKFSDYTTQFYCYQPP